MADLSLIPDAAWLEAQRRAEVIRPFAKSTHRPRHLILAAAIALGLSERRTYTLVRRYRDAGGDLTALLPGRSSGGRDRSRVSTASEVVLHQTVHELYLDPAEADSSTRCARGARAMWCRQAAPAITQHRFDAVLKRCLSPTCDAAARSTPKQSRCMAMPRMAGIRWTWCRWIIRRWT